jgi:endonuclease/exonuclease/phosphatase family metal-dependent hydrolase
MSNPINHRSFRLETYMRYKKTFLLILLFTIQLSAEVQYSIIPIVNELEKGRLSREKYTIAQYKAISDALKPIDEKVRIVSYNMLFDVCDGQQLPENRWPKRLPRIVALLEDMQPDIICTQELQRNQLDDLTAKIGNTFTFYFKPSFSPAQKASRDFDGVFYKKDRFSLLDAKTWTVKHTIKNTIVTMVHLLDLLTKKELFVFNAHFPFNGPEEREKTAIEIAQIIQPYAEKKAVVLAGDMNTFANRPDMKRLPYYDGDWIESCLTHGNIKDSYRKSFLGHVGPISSFTNNDDGSNGFKGNGTPGIILDHFFVSDLVSVLLHGINPAQVDDHYPSDHMPVLIDIVNISSQDNASI